MYEDDFGLAVAIALGFLAFFVIIVAACAASEEQANEEIKRNGATTAVQMHFTDKSQCEFRMLTEKTNSEGMWLAGCYEAVDVIRAQK